MKKMDKTDAQWKSELSATEYQILRKEGTEASFSHPTTRNIAKVFLPVLPVQHHYLRQT